MSLLVLVPSLICLFFVLRGRIDTALLYVYLPCVLLFPESFSIRLAHLPEVSIAEIAVIPLGAVALYRLVRKGRPVLMDILVALFVASVTISEVLYEHVTKDGLCIAAICFLSMFLPYAIGRTLIEPNLRLATVRRIVILVLFLGLPGIFEWRMGRNLYAPLGKVFGVVKSQAIQMRGGRGRFSAAFSDAEIGGIAIAVVAMLNAWLAYLWRTRLWENPGRLFSVLERYRIAEMLLLFYVFLTQSRGPELALIIGYLILQIPRFRNPKRAIGVVAVLVVLAGIAAYIGFSRYTDVSDINAIHDEQQGSALYRRRMIELYQPILDEGGWLGWGYKSIPHAAGLGNLGNGVQSIDNWFLFVDLAQGRFGYIVLLLIVEESIRTLAVRSWRLSAKDDRAFVVSMLAAMAVLWIALLTVYMGDQLPELAFLCLGWGQSIEAGTQVQEVMPFAFKRVLT